MLSSDQRREKLESLLLRVQANRSRSGAAQAKAAQAPAAGPHAPPAPEPRTTPGAASVQGIEIGADLVDTESTDSLLDLEFDAGIDDGVALVDAPPPKRAEAKAAPKPAATAGLEEPATLVESIDLEPGPKPAAKPAARPAPAPKVEAAPAPKLAPPSPGHATKKPAAAPPAQAEDIDDEPEIEVSYGTQEALALQAELGYGDDEGEFADSDTQITTGDQLTLADLPYQPKAAAKPAPMELTDLPAPGPKGAELDELTEPSAPVPAAARSPASRTAPTTPVPSVETPKPSELEATATVPLTQPSIREAQVPDRTRLHAKTVEDLDSLAELSLVEEEAPAAVEKAPAPGPAAAQPTPPPARSATPAPAPAAAAAAPSQSEITRQVAFKPMAAVAPPKRAEAAAPAAPAQEAKPAEPTVHGFAPAAIDAEAKVEAFSGAVPTPRPRTLGELIRLALAVGKK